MTVGTEISREEQRKKLVPAEGNFEEYPYFRVGDRNASTGIMPFQNQLRTKDGNVLQQTWVVRAAHGMGLPGRYDQDVYMALLHLIDIKGLPEDGWVSFSIYELVELMNKRHSGREYQQVRESLRKLATTSIESYNAFYHKGSRSYISDTFSLLTEVKLAEYEDVGGERRDRNRVHLSRYFVDSYKANYLKNIDIRFYWSLASPIAKRLYRLIDKKRGGRRRWEAELFSLKERIPLSDYKYPSKIKEKLRPAHDELVQKGFLESVAYRKADGTEYAAYEISEEFHARRASALEQLNNDQMFCVQRLVAEGMARDTAEELVVSYGSARVMHYVEALPYQKNIRNPAGWLRRAIQNNYELDMPPASSTGEDPEPNGVPEQAGAGGDQAALFTHRHAREIRAPEPDEASLDLWEPLLDAAAEEVGSPTLRLWFDGAVPVDLQDGRLILSVPHLQAKDYIETRFMDILLKHLRERLGERATIEVHARSDA